VGGHPVGIIPNAVAAVGGSGGVAPSSANPQLACEVCVLQNVTFGSSSGSTLQTSGGQPGYRRLRQRVEFLVPTPSRPTVGMGLRSSGRPSTTAVPCTSTIRVGPPSPRRVLSGSITMCSTRAVGNVTLTGRGRVYRQWKQHPYWEWVLSESPTPGTGTTPAFTDPYAAAPTPLPSFLRHPISLVGGHPGRLLQQ